MATTTATTIKVEVGTEFRSIFQDSNALWAVTGKAGPGVWHARITDDNMDYAGQTDVFTTERIRRSVAQYQNIGRMVSESDAWYAAQPLGSIVHYHNGSGQVVRCEVAEVNGKHGLVPIALVGKWAERDLPHYTYMGKVDPGEGGRFFDRHDRSTTHAWQPSLGCVWESGKCSYERDGDPTGLDPIDLTLPESTDDEIEAARVFGLSTQVREILDGWASSKGEPADAMRDCLMAVRSLLNESMDHHGQAPTPEAYTG